jgi:hypothetical protein
MCCKTCSSAWTAPSRRSFAACLLVSSRAFPASRDGDASTPAPTRRRATVPAWTTALWSCPRWGGLPCAGVARWSAPPRPSPARAADGWYVSFSCAEVPTQLLPPTGRETGIAVGLTVFLVTAEGEVVENPHYRKAEKALAKAQQRLSRRKKGSKRRDKARKLVAKKHQQVRRQRRDCHHQTALALLRQYVWCVARRPAGRQPGAEPPPGQEQQGCRLGAVPHHPCRQSSIRWAASGSGGPCRHDAGLQRLWDARAQKCAGAHACLLLLRSLPRP